MCRYFSDISSFWTILQDETVIHDIRNLIKRNGTQTIFARLFTITLTSRSPNTELSRYQELILLEHVMNNFVNAMKYQVKCSFFSFDQIFW